MLAAMLLADDLLLLPNRRAEETAEVQSCLEAVRGAS
jgi:hypothetical protein